jgi:hypothetical protein
MTDVKKTDEAAGPDETTAGPDETTTGPDDTTAGPDNQAAEQDDTAAGAETGAAAGEQPAMTEDELRAQLEEQFRKQKVSDLLVQYMVSLSTLAYMKMGITEDTQEVKDLEQARLAIDSYKALLDSAGDRLGEQDRKALSGALASMQMTFVQAAEGGKGTEGGKEAEGGKETEGAGEPGSGKGKSEPGGDSGKQGSDPASRLWVPGKE